MSERREYSMQSLPKAGRWAIYVSLAVLFAVACAFLSHWQFSRNQERSTQLALVAENYDQDAVALDELIPAGSELDPEDQWRPVMLTGTYLADEQLLARNRAHGGTAAFEVLVPFELDNGRVILIDRGWLAPGERRPIPDVVPAPPGGEVTVIARLRPGEALPPSGRSAPDGQVPTINLDLVTDTVDPVVGASLEQSAYGVMVSEEPAPPTQPNALESPSEDPGPYLSYAIQWILFAVMGFVFIGYVIHTERRRRQDDADDLESESVPAPVAPRRRRDRDAVDEDALIDAAQR